jgi:hypothetical protein
MLPQTLAFLAAFGDIDAVRTAIEQDGHYLAAISEAFTIACPDHLSHRSLDP